MESLFILLIICQYFSYYNCISADINLLSYNGEGYVYPYPEECMAIMDDFADYASNLTLCSIKNARPIRLCEKCITNFIKFDNKFKELKTKVVNGTTCESIFISHDRLDAIQEYYDNILSVWTKANCHNCYVWNGNDYELSEKTKKFYNMFNETMNCITSNIDPKSNTSDAICEKCMQSYLHLDEFYKSLSPDSIGVDSICMDVVDAMNSTRSIWSKSLNCCKLRKSPEIVFLCCTGIISILPIFYYLVLAYCGPMRDLPNVLKQSRFSQSIQRALHRRND